MIWAIDDPEFSCGWVSPDGHTFSCVKNEHEKMARYLLLHMVNGVHTRRAKKHLLQAGWAMIFADGKLFAVQALTPEQSLRLSSCTAR